MRCQKRTEWGQCCQRSATRADRMCTVHRFFLDTGRPLDPYWHEKVVKGWITPTVDWMNRSELHAVVNGRYRGDGRRIDQYVAGDPLLIDTEAFL